MRVAPQRSPWLQLVTLLGGFLVGPSAAFALSRALAPESDFVQGLSIFAMTAVYIGGMLLWTGIGFLTEGIGFVWRLVRGRWRERRFRPGEELVPAGHRAFPVLGTALGALSGLVAAAATDLTLVPALGSWTVLGLCYGLLLRAAAQHGYLPFLVPE